MSAEKGEWDVGCAEGIRAERARLLPLFDAVEYAIRESPCTVSMQARNIDRERCACAGCAIMRVARAALARARGESA